MQYINGYRSILNQDKSPPKFEIIVPDPDDGIDYYAILDRICEISDPINKKAFLNRAMDNLVGFSPGKNCGKLYPIEVALVYHMFFRGQFVFLSEESLDRHLFTFLKNRDLDKFMIELANAVDGVVHSILAARIVLATFGDGPRPQDKLPVNYRQPAADAIKIQATAKAASDVLHKLRSATVEQLVLGRISYLAFWHWQNKPTPVLTSPLPLLRYATNRMG